MGTRILLADDSAVYRKIFLKAAEETAPHAAIKCCLDSGEVREAVEKHDFDIIILDAETNDIEVLLPYIVREIPKAWILITARPAAKVKKLCADMLAKGAADFLVKPIYDSYAENAAAIKLKLKGALKVIEARQADEDKLKKTQIKRTAVMTRTSKFKPKLVLIASSTGGPIALEKVIGKLRQDFPAPILIVQHIAQNFIEILTSNLDSKSQIKVKVAEDGENVQAGTVYMAPGGLHMKIDSDMRVYFENSPPLNGTRPAADALFISAAEALSDVKILTVILTGMGHDGLKGVIALKEHDNCLCFAQSEETCVVYGMPRAVIESGYADKVLDINEISYEIENLFF